MTGFPMRKNSTGSHWYEPSVYNHLLKNTETDSWLCRRQCHKRNWQRTGLRGHSKLRSVLSWFAVIGLGDSTLCDITKGQFL